MGMDDFDARYVAPVRFRLGDEDASQYDRGEEWFTFDHKAIMSARAGELARLEGAMDYTFAEMTRDFYRRSATAMRAAMWVSRRKAGVQEQWASFDPHVWAAEWDFLAEDEGDGDDANPPDEAAAEATE